MQAQLGGGVDAVLEVFTLCAVATVERWFIYNSF